MARPLRLEFPGAIYHLTARGNAQQAIFLDDGDRQYFLRLLGREVQQQQWRCYVCCLMGNHYHLVIETPEPNLSRGMKRLQAPIRNGSIVGINESAISCRAASRVCCWKKNDTF